MRRIFSNRQRVERERHRAHKNWKFFGSKRRESAPSDHGGWLFFYRVEDETSLPLLLLPLNVRETRSREDDDDETMPLFFLRPLLLYSRGARIVFFPQSPKGGERLTFFSILSPSFFAFFGSQTDLFPPLFFFRFRPNREKTTRVGSGRFVSEFERRWWGFAEFAIQRY